MYCVFVNDDGPNYSGFIVAGLKGYETRGRDMLKRLVGHRVAIASTGKGRRPVVVGYATITEKFYCCFSDFEKYRAAAMIPAGDKYDATEGRGKWFYRMAAPGRCKPYPLPENRINHGRAYCEF